MNRFKCVIVTILYCLGVTETGQGVFLSQSETKWDESTCTLAQPDIICSDDGSCVVENGLEFLNNINIPDNGVWIGFTKTWISYAYVGCNQVNVGIEYSVPTLGECRRRTGCQTFGIRNSTEGLRCKCASNSHVHSGTCRRKCQEADQYPCGDSTDTTIFSIYTVENVPPSSHAQEKYRNCLLFFYAYGGQGHNYYWQSCNLISTPSLLCSSRDFTDQNQMAQTFYERNQKWAVAVEHCFVEKNFPATIQSIKNAQFTKQNTQDYWTGIIKKESIISLTYMLGHSTNPPVTYGYMEQINQTVYVRFANKGESKRSLCAGDCTSRLPTTTTRETQTTHSESTTSQVTTTKGGTSRISTISTRETQSNYSESTTQVRNTKDDTTATPSILTRATQLNTFSTTSEVNSAKGSSTLIAVGVPIAGILLVAVVLSVVIWRRGMLRTCFKNAVIENTTRQPTAEVCTAVDNQQRVEYVNTTSNVMHRNTGDTRDAQTYEKLNMTSRSDNYLSLQEIDTDRHFYQNT